MKYVAIHAARKRNFLLRLSLRHTVPLDSAIDMHEKSRNLSSLRYLRNSNLSNPEPSVKTQKWPTAKEQPLASTIALACQNNPRTTHSTKPTNVPNSTSFVFYFLPANKIILENFCINGDHWAQKLKRDKPRETATRSPATLDRHSPAI